MSETFKNKNWMFNYQPKFTALFNHMAAKAVVFEHGNCEKGDKNGDLIVFSGDPFLCELYMFVNNYND